MSRAIENFYVSGFIGNDDTGRNQNRLFAYDTQEMSHREVKTDAGLNFTPYSDVFVRAGQLFVIGRASDAADQSAVGNELYGFDENGNVTLAADVRQGAESSFIQADSALSITGYPTLTLATARYDSDQYEAVAFVEDGTIMPFGDFFAGFESVLNLRSPVEFEGNTVFLAAADQRPIVPWAFNAQRDTFDFLVDFTQPVSGVSFEHLYVLEDTLYARINTFEWGRELWALNAQSQWALISDVSPGRGYGAPTYEFTFNDAHYFTAVNNTFGRELYRLDAAAGLVRVSDLEPGRDNGVNFTRSFEHDGAVYFYTTGTYPGFRLYRMEANETFTRVTDFAEGLAGSYPALILDMDTETVIMGENFGGTYGLHFVLQEGALSYITLPEGALSSAEIIEGRIYVTMTAPDGGFSVWLMQPEGTWENLITLEGTEGIQRVIHMSVASLEPTAPVMDPIDLPVHTGDDTVMGTQAAEILYGGPGEDTLLVQSAQSAHTLRLAQGLTTLENRAAPSLDTDILASIEFLDFDDKIPVSNGQPLSLAQIDGVAGLNATALEDLVELYIAYFNRAPDALGLYFWGDVFAAGYTLQQIAPLFIDSAEYRATYSDNLSNADFATAVYNNVLGRVPDPTGFDFWVGALDGGGVSRDQFILSVLGGAKVPPPGDATQAFIDQQLLDRQYLADKTDIGAYFSVLKGMSDVEDASAVMALFDGSAASITAAVDAIDGFYADALDAETGAFLVQVVGVLDDPFSVG